VIVTVLLLALGIGVIAALPAQRVRHAAAHSQHQGHGASTTTTTTAPGSASTATPTSKTGPAIKVGILAPSGSATVADVQATLTSAGCVLEAEQPIPYAWVAGLTGPFVRYPPGYETEASHVASALHVASGNVQPDLPGGSIGSDIIEVFVPA
jgi:hypothetical protein